MKKQRTCTYAKEENTPGCYLKARHVLAIMGFAGMFNVYALRTNLSVAIIAMVNNTEQLKTTANQSDICPDKGASIVSDTPTNGVFDWDPVQRGLVLGCYYYGYIISNVPGAWLARRIGFKKVLGGAMFFSSIITLVTPAAAYTSFELFVALRVIHGFFQGVSFPTMYGAWGSWAPPMERSILVSAHVSGASFGTCVTWPLAGLIADGLGWEAVFYFTGGCGLLWTVFWFLLIHDTPNQHPRISEQERKYINESIGLDKPKDKVPTPWKSMLTSLPIFGILVAHFASNWGNYTLLAMLPTYMSTILKFNLATSGFLSSLPFILKWVITLLGGYITDMIRKRSCVSTVVIRKINTTLGLGIPALFVVLAGYIGCNATAAVACFAMSVAFIGVTVSGIKANTLDIAPKYGGIVFGISNTVSNIPGFLAPQVVGFLLQNKNSLGQWHTVFWISAAIYLTGAVTYLVCGSGVEQPWAKGNITERKQGRLKLHAKKFIPTHEDTPSSDNKQQIENKN